MWNQPGEDILAGIRICECTKLSNDHTLLCNGSHISICPDKPKWRKESKCKIHFMGHWLPLRLPIHAASGRECAKRNNHVFAGVFHANVFGIYESKSHVRTQHEQTGSTVLGNPWHHPVLWQHMMFHTKSHSTGYSAAIQMQYVTLINDRLTSGSRWPGHSWSQICAWGPGHRRGDRRVHLWPQKARVPDGEGFPSETKESGLQNERGSQKVFSVLSYKLESINFQKSAVDMQMSKELFSCLVYFCLKDVNKPVTVVGRVSDSSSHVSKSFL